MARRLIPRPTAVGSTVLVAGVAVVVAAAVGCARESDELDAVGLADAVPAALAPEDPASVTDVRCPQEVERGEGVVVTCAALVGGTPVTATVEQVDDEGRVSVTTEAVLLDKADVAAGLADRLQEDLGVLVGADCGAPRVVVPSTGMEFPCTATDEAGRPLELVVRLLDETGAYEVRPA